MFQEIKQTIIITCIGRDGNKRNDTNILQRRQPPSVECFRFLRIFIRFEKKDEVKEMMNQLSDTLKVIDGSPGRAKDILPADGNGQFINGIHETISASRDRTNLFSLGSLESTKCFE